MSDQLQTLFFAVAAPCACVAIGALIILAAGVRIIVADALANRAAKRARIDVLEHRYRERLIARSGRSAVVVHLDQRRVAR